MAPGEQAISLNPAFCAALREQAEGALALGPDPEEAFRIRDLLAVALMSGEMPVNAGDALPDDVRADREAIERGINELLPELDMAQLQGSDPAGALDAYHAAYDEASQRVLDYVDANCG